ncbi:MAG: small multi-drug export protein [Phycisphaerales bacterium]|nr:small multi-drug export protein [Phycisphaerales bacterium]
MSPSSEHIPPGSAQPDAALIAGEARFDRELRERRPLLWALTLAGPPLATLALLAWVWLVHGWDFVAKLAGFAVITFFGAGRFIILFGKADHAAVDTAAADGGLIEALRMTPTQLFVMVTWMDMVAAVLLVFHAGFLLRIPKIGPAMAALSEEGRFVMARYPKVRRWTFVGLATFVIVPLAATGSVGGAIFGRLLGMGRGSTLVAIFIGSVVGNGIMLAGAGVLNRYIDTNNPVFLVGGITVIVGLVIALERRYRKIKRSTLGRASATPSGGAPPR